MSSNWGEHMTRKRAQAAAHLLVVIFALTLLGPGRGAAESRYGDVLIQADSDNDGQGAIRLRTGATDKAIVTNAGKVGIGTTAPSQQLHVYSASGDTKGLLESPIAEWKLKAGSAQAGFWSGGADAWLYTSTNHPLILGTNNTEKLRITPTGKMGLGTVNPAYTLDIVGDVRWTGLLQGGSVPWSRLSGVPPACPSGQFVTAIGGTSLTCVAPPGGGSSASLGWLNVKDFGAIPDDTGDDTTAIQAALNVAMYTTQAAVVFPAGTYLVRDLVLSPSSSPSKVINVNLIGLAASDDVILRYIGTSGTALTIANNQNFHLENLRIMNRGTGTNTGLKITSLTGSSSTGPATVNNVRIDAFDVGLQIGGDAGNSASEMLFENVYLYGNTTGVLCPPTAYYTTNINMKSLLMSQGTTGVLWQCRGGLHIDGGSASYVTTVFKLQIPSRGNDTTSISNYFAEGQAQLLVWGPDTPGPGYGGVLKVSNLAAYWGSPLTRQIVLNALGNVTISDSAPHGLIEIAGQIDASNSDGFREGVVTIEGNAFGTPIGYVVSGAQNTRVYVRGNIQARSGNIQLDEIFYLDSSGNRTNITGP